MRRKRRATENINKLISDFMIYSYAYYKLGESLISDAEFDGICEKIKSNYNEITHPHKKLIDNLNVYSGYYLGNRYPTIVKACAIEMIKGKNNATNVDRDKRGISKPDVDQKDPENGMSDTNISFRRRKRRH